MLGITNWVNQLNPDAVSSWESGYGGGLAGPAIGPSLGHAGEMSRGRLARLVRVLTGFWRKALRENMKIPFKFSNLV
jgi:hypothetical protein